MHGLIITIFAIFIPKTLSEQCYLMITTTQKPHWLISIISVTELRNGHCARRT